MEDLVKFYKNRRVFVTGHTGFKGSWLTLWLKRFGANVCAVALPPASSPSLFRAARCGTGIESHYADIRDAAKLDRLMRDFRPEVVFHLAAQALVGVSYRKPLETFATNVQGSANLLESVRRIKSVRSLVYATSDKCYENRETGRLYRESDRLGGKDPYAASKAAAEIVFGAYRQSFFSEGSVGAASVRAGNVIGGGDWSEGRIVTDIARHLAAGKSAPIYHPEAIRPWQHVLEPLYGYLILAKVLYRSPKKFSGSWNLGPSSGKVRLVKDLAERMIAAWGKGSWVSKKSRGFREAGVLRLSSAKARRGLGWRTVLTFDETVSKTAHWYRGYYAGTPAVRLCERDFEDYEKKVLYASKRGKR